MQTKQKSIAISTYIPSLSYAERQHCIRKYNVFHSHFKHNVVHYIINHFVQEIQQFREWSRNFWFSSVSNFISIPSIVRFNSTKKNYVVVISIQKWGKNNVKMRNLSFNLSVCWDKKWEKINLFKKNNEKNSSLLTKDRFSDRINVILNENYTIFV